VGPKGIFFSTLEDLSLKPASNSGETSSLSMRVSSNRLLEIEQANFLYRVEEGTRACNFLKMRRNTSAGVQRVFRKKLNPADDKLNPKGNTFSLVENHCQMLSPEGDQKKQRMSMPI